MVYIILGKGFEEIEAVAPMDILRRAQIPAQYAGIGGLTITGAHGIRIESECTVEEIDRGAMDMIVLPGGMGGVESIEESPAAMDAVKFALDSDRYVAAICAAPTILGKRGWIDGKKATCYPGMEDDMGGAVMQPGAKAVVDGRLITGQAPCAAVDFGLTLAEILKGSEARDTVRRFMVYDG